MRSDITSAKSFTRVHLAESGVSLQLAVGIAEPSRKRRRGVEYFASRCHVFCDYQLVTRLPRFLTPSLAGLAVTVVQLAMAVCLLAPEEPVTKRYSALIQHDSYWFMNIIDAATGQLCRRSITR